MKVVCTSVNDFLHNITVEGFDKVLHRVIYVDYVKNPLGDNQRDCVKWKVFLSASAVMVTEDEGEYLLEVGVNCGVDYTDKSNDLKGSKKALELKSQIEECCKNHNLTIRPGVVEI